MRMLFQVTKAELRNLFYSPVAWFLLVAFLAQCAWFYSDELTNYANLQDLYMKNNPKFTHWDNQGFTRIFFLGMDGTFLNVFQNLYLFVPLLTMGLIGREVQSGSIKLLFSSPVKLRQIVLGKFTAIMVFNVFLLLILGIFMISAAFQVKDIDYGLLLSAALGFYLLTCAYTAIGLFMSSLTTYPIVAALGTFLIIFALTNIGTVWQQYDFVRDLTFFLHLAGRTEKMLLGLITTKDLIYFFIIVGIFLSFTLLKLKATREKKPWHVKALRYTAVMAVGLLIGYISSRPALTGYWDTTAQQVNTIDPKTQQIIREMGDAPLEVTLYTNLVGPGMQPGLPQNRNAYLSWLWDPILRFKPDIKFRYEYYYDHDSTIMGNFLYRNFPGRDLDGIAKQAAELFEIDLGYWKKPAEMQKQINLRPEALRLVMQLKYKDRTSFLRTFDDNTFWPQEPQVAAALKKLLAPVVPKLGFVTGHYERSIHKTGEREFAIHTAATNARRSLINLGFDLDTISLDQEDIPADLTALVLADPKSELSPVCREKIRRYIAAGGNMMIMGEPGKQSILNPVLKQIGVQLLDGLLMSPNTNDMQDNCFGGKTNSLASLYADPSRTSLDYKEYGGGGALLRGATAITWTDTAGFTARTLMEAGAWLRKGPFIRDSARMKFEPGSGDLTASMINFPMAAPLTYIQSGKAAGNHDDHDDHDHGHDHGHEHAQEKGSHKGTSAFAACMAFYRTIHHKDQRIIVIGDADWAANTQVLAHGLAVKLYSWLINGEFPVYFDKPEPEDNLLRITSPSAEVFKTIFLWILPASLALAGTIILIRRKRK